MKHFVQYEHEGMIIRRFFLQEGEDFCVELHHLTDENELIDFDGANYANLKIGESIPWEGSTRLKRVA